MNMIADSMSIICHVGIMIGDNGDPALENAPAQEQHQQVQVHQGGDVCQL